jgi:hypothetical protein
MRWVLLAAAAAALGTLAARLGHAGLEALAVGVALLTAVVAVRASAEDERARPRMQIAEGRTFFERGAHGESSFARALIKSESKRRSPCAASPPRHWHLPVARRD